jgi:hypothetical protein
LLIKLNEVARMGQTRYAYRFLIEKLERKRPFVRPRHRWEDNIKMHLRDILSEGVELICVAQDRDLWRVDVNTVMNLRVL